MYITLTDGQPVAIIGEWVFVSALWSPQKVGFITCLLPVCDALTSEICIPIVSRVTGWLALVQNWTVTTIINFSRVQLIFSAIALWRDG